MLAQNVAQTKINYLEGDSTTGLQGLSIPHEQIQANLSFKGTENQFLWSACRLGHIKASVLYTKVTARKS